MQGEQHTAREEFILMGAAGMGENAGDRGHEKIGSMVSWVDDMKPTGGAKRANLSALCKLSLSKNR
jgi:hypothetical protein